MKQGQKGFREQLRRYMEECGFRPGNLRLCCNKDPAKPKLMLQQYVVQFLTKPESGVQRLLISHETGSGKTLTMISIVDNYLPSARPIYIMLPNGALVQNFLEQLATYTNTNLGRYFAAVMRKHPDVKLATAEGRERATAYLRAHRPMTDGRGSIPGPAGPVCVLCMTTGGGTTMINADVALDGTREPKFKGPNNPRYPWIGAANPYDDAVVVVDEAHNLFDVADRGSETVGANVTQDRLRARALWALYYARRCRVFFATATPFGTQPVSEDSLGRIMRQVMGHEAHADPARSVQEGYLSCFGGRPEGLYPKIVREKCAAWGAIGGPCSRWKPEQDAMALTNIVSVPLENETRYRYFVEMFRKKLTISLPGHPAPCTNEPSVAQIESLIGRNRSPCRPTSKEPPYPERTALYTAYERHIALVDGTPADELMRLPGVAKTLGALQGYQHSSVYQHHAFNAIPDTEPRCWATKLAAVAKHIQKNLTSERPVKLLVLVSQVNGLATLLRIMHDWNATRTAEQQRERRFAVMASRPDRSPTEPSLKARADRNLAMLANFNAHGGPWSTCIADSALYGEGTSFTGITEMAIVGVPKTLTKFLQLYGRIIRACQHLHFVPRERVIRIYLFISTATNWTRSKTKNRTPDEIYLENIMIEFRRMVAYDTRLAAMSVDADLYLKARVDDADLGYRVRHEARLSPSPRLSARASPRLSARASPPPRINAYGELTFSPEHKPRRGTPGGSRPRPASGSGGSRRGLGRTDGGLRRDQPWSLSAEDSDGASSTGHLEASRTRQGRTSYIFNTPTPFRGRHLE